jgi:hypothetical protein
MADEHDWIEITLDAGSRRGVAEVVERRASDANKPVQLLRVLRSSRNELLLDREQAQVVLDALNVDRRLSALRARLEAFLGLR